ncbi:Integral membrane protein [Prescottella defluvii]|uniref:hypothetical protein n=1 Tax=Prescottella defluvii TaxID=1323361 RepID=UPI0004F29589|nr:hypothetical protein [Prescottella defluvii]
MIIIGLVILIAAVAIGVAGVVNNTGGEHLVRDDFTIFGVQVTGSTGTLFLAGLIVGAAGMLGLALLLAGSRRHSRRERQARHELARRESVSAVGDGGAVTAPTTRSAAHGTAPVRSWRHPFGGGATAVGSPHPTH